MKLFEKRQLSHEGVVFPVCNLGGIKLVVPFVVITDEVAKFFDPLGGQLLL